MPSLKEIKRRIASINSTRQITKAMKMVAAAKMRRAQENMTKARPYSNKLKQMIAELAAMSEHDAHPLLEVREPNEVGIVVVTSDRGLAGSFSSSVIKRTEKLIKELDGTAKEIRLFTVGRKANDYFKKRNWKLEQSHYNLQELDFGVAQSIGDAIVREYEIGYVEDAGLDRIYLVYNEFKNVVQQELKVEQILPVIPDEAEGGFDADFIFEPGEREVLDHVLPLYVNVTIWRVLLESFAAEQAARMTAMENATNNAGDMIDSLTLIYNKARQTAITTEILEVISGAEGLQ